MSKKFGIRMDGCENPIEQLIVQYLTLNKDKENFTLLEIGSAGCVSLRAFRDIVSENWKKEWAVIGTDLSPDKAWSLNWSEVNSSINGTNCQFHEISQSKNLNYDVLKNGFHLVLADNPRFLLENQWTIPLDIVFIDGCHGKCAGFDFLAIEKKVKIGGIVIFHDYGEIEQGSDWQSHCNEFINVRTYVHRLGLNQPCNKLRKGWRFIAEIKGSRNWGGDGNSCAVVQRTNEELDKEHDIIF